MIMLKREEIIVFVFRKHTHNEYSARIIKLVINENRRLIGEPRNTGGIIIWEYIAVEYFLSLASYFH